MSNLDIGSYDEDVVREVMDRQFDLGIHFHPTIHLLNLAAL